MAAKNVYLKRLDVIEALGSVNIIASDKTGTLTKNVMTVTDVWTYENKVAGVPEKMSMDTAVSGKTGCLQRLMTVMSVCNVANFKEKEDNKLDRKPDEPRPANGSPSEVAMIQYCDRIFDIYKLRGAHQLVFEIPFNSKRKWHLQIHKEKDLGQGMSEYRLMMKGAPEILIKKCSTIYTENGITELDDFRLNSFQVGPFSFSIN